LGARHRVPGFPPGREVHGCRAGPHVYSHAVGSDQSLTTAVRDNSSCRRALGSLRPTIATGMSRLRKCSLTWSRAATAEESHTCEPDMSITTLVSPCSA